MKATAKKQVTLEGLAAALWCLLTLVTDRAFFRYEAGPRLLAYKAAFLVLAFLLLHGMVTLVKKLRAGDTFARRWLRWTLPYLAVLLAVLAVVWPGYFGNDDMTILSQARVLGLNAAHHFLTSSAFILSLMFVPMPGGIVLVQVLLIASAAGCFLAAVHTLAEWRFGPGVKWQWCALLYLPLLLPPVVAHAVQPFRSTWSTGTELFLVFVLAALYLRGTPVRRRELAAVAVLGILTAAWRSESIYYLAAIPVLLAVLCGKKLVRPAAAAVVSVCVVAGTLLCSKANSALMGPAAWQYQAIALFSQTAAVVQDADPAADAEALAKIDLVYDVAACRENTTTHGAAMLELMLRDKDSPTPRATAADWAQCRSGIVTLALKYPKSVLRERLGVFLDTMSEGHSRESHQRIAFAAPLLMYEGEPTALTREFTAQSLAAYPLDQALRSSFTSALVFGKGAVGRAAGLCWEILPALILLAAAVVLLAVRRQWMLFLAAGCFLARVPLVFLTAPDTYFMYYLTPYTAGCILAVCAVVWAVLRHKEKTERKPG